MATAGACRAVPLTAARASSWRHWTVGAAGKLPARRGCPASTQLRASSSASSPPTDRAEPFSRSVTRGAWRRTGGPSSVAVVTRSGDEGGCTLMHLRDINVAISGFPIPVQSLIFNPHVVTLKEGESCSLRCTGRCARPRWVATQARLGSVPASSLSAAATNLCFAHRCDL